MTVHPSDPSVAYIDVEDFPGVDPDTEDGRITLAMIMGERRRDNPSKSHFIIRSKGEMVGEMIIRDERNQ